MHVALPLALFLTLAGLEVAAQEPFVIDRVEHHDVDNNGVNVHYVTLGEVVTGETLLFVHGFPNFWYVWHNQMEAFADEYRVVAMDTRATNRSGKPEGVESYDMPLLLSDINAVIDDLGVDRVTLVAHDWGGIISWEFVMDETYASRVERLIMMNLTHPRGFSRTLANATPEQRRATEYVAARETRTVMLLSTVPSAASPGMRIRGTVGAGQVTTSREGSGACSTSSFRGIWTGMATSTSSRPEGTVCLGTASSGSSRCGHPSPWRPSSGLERRTARRCLSLEGGNNVPMPTTRCGALAGCDLRAYHVKLCPRRVERRGRLGGPAEHETW